MKRRARSDADARLREALAAMADPVLVGDEEGVVTDVNPAAEQLFGRAADQLVGRSLFTLVVDGDCDELRARAVTHDGLPFVAHGKVEPEGEPGGTRSVELTCSRGEVGGRRVLLVVAREEGQARHAERGSWLETAADRVPAPIWASSPDGLLVYANDAWLEFTGRSLADELGDGWLTNVHPDDVEACRAAVAGADPETGLEIETRVRRADGEYRWVQMRAAPRTHPDHGFAGWVVSSFDLTEERTLNDALRRRARQQAAVADLGRAALLGRDVDDLLDDAVRVVAEVFDVDIAAAMELLPRGDELLLRAAYGFESALSGTTSPRRADSPAGVALDRGGPITFDDLRDDEHIRAPRLLELGVRSGIVVPVRGRDRPYGVLAAYATRSRRFGDDDVVFLRNVANVLAAAILRRRTEYDLRGREAEARLAFDAGGMGSWLWDPRTGAMTWSPELERLCGLDAGSFAGTFRAFVDFVHPDDREATLQAMAEAEARGDLVSEYRIVRPDGALRWVEARGRPLPEGPPARWIGVTIDITDRKHAEDELRAREATARLAFEAGRIGAWKWEPESGRLVFSEELEAVLGLEAGASSHDAEVVRLLIAPDDRDRVRTGLDEALERRGLHLEYRVLHPDGRMHWIEARGRPMPRQAGEPETWTGVGIDVTERNQADEELRRLLDVERLVRAEAEAATHALTETVARLDTLLNHAPIGLAFFDLDLRILRVNEPLAELNGLPVDAHLGRTLAEIVPDLWPQLESSYRQVADTGEAVVGVEIGGRVPRRPGSEQHFLVSVYPVPEPGGSLIGIGSIVVDITDRKRAERRTQMLAGASELFASSIDLDDMLDRVCAVVVPTFADSCMLHLRPVERRRRQFAVADVDAEMRDRLLDAERARPLDFDGDDEVGRALREGTVLVESVTDDMRAMASGGDEERAELLDAHGVVSMIAVPLEARGERFGVLVLSYTRASGRRYEPADVELAEDLAHRFAQAIENARLTLEAVRAQERLLLLARVGELVTIELDSTARLERVAHLVLPTFADCCSVYVLEPDGQLRLCAFSHVEVESQAALEQLAERPLLSADSHAPPAEAARTGEPVLLPSVPSSLVTEVVAGAEHQRVARSSGIRSTLAVPMEGPEGTIGALVFAYAGSGRRYGVDDLPIAQEIARRVAPAVENAFRFEREQATAEILQRSLLPEELPRFADVELTARYLPGTAGVKIGGDWYDVVRVDDDRIVLAIGDVVGHGVRAAAAMGKLRHTLQFCALERQAPSEILDRLNAYTCTGDGGDMATLLVMVYSPRTGSLRFSSAGHPPPLVRDPDGGLQYLPGGRGMPLGASPGAQYTDDQVVLSPGSVLVLYTDGLVERRREPLDVGFLRLGEVLSHAPDDLESLADHLLHELLERDGPRDDVAVLVARPLAQHGALDLWLPARPHELAPLRRTLGDWLARVGANSTEAFEVTVSVNEIAANAIEHAYGFSDARFSVEGRFDDDTVVFVVRDSGQWREQRDQGDRGRGLDIVRTLMDEVEIEPGPEGTEVRMRRRLRGVARG